MFIHSLSLDFGLLLVFGCYEALPCVFLYKSLCGYMFSFLLSKYLEVEWLSHMVNVYLTL